MVNGKWQNSPSLRSLAFERPSVLEGEAAKKAVVSRKSEKWEKSKAARKVTQRTLVCSL